MPNYTLKCQKCGYTFTTLVKHTELKSICCPQCGDKNCDRVFAGAKFTVGKSRSGG